MTIPTYPNTLKGLVYPVKRSPIWNTDKQVAVSGKVTAQQLWTYPRYKIEQGYSFLRSDSVNAEWQTLQGFYNQVGGGALPFQFTDPDDGSISAQAIGVGDGATTDFQLVRALGGFVEPVFLPTAQQVFLEGVLTATYTMQPGGMVRFDAAPGNGVAITWTGTYNWLCRFDDDSLDFSKFMYQFWELSKISFTTEKY